MGNATPCSFVINEDALVALSVEYHHAKEDSEHNWSYTDDLMKGTITHLLIDESNEWVGWKKLPKNFKNEDFAYKLT